MAYSVKATRVEPGVYTLSFGKGKKKLTTTCRCGAGGWTVADNTVCAQASLRNAKQAWGVAAEARYYHGAAAEAVTPEHVAGEEGESHEYRQSLIDNAPDRETAAHIKEINEAMEDVVADLHEKAGEPYTKRTYRMPVPKRKG